MQSYAARRQWLERDGRHRLLLPSILSADFSRLGADVAEVAAAGAAAIHVDVMDGHFVPNLTLGPAVVTSLRAATPLVLDCHLMVTHPRQWIEPFAQAGADVITVHVEASECSQALSEIRQAGCLAGISLNPKTPIERLLPLLAEVDLVLVMSVEPGFAGQRFMPEALTKLRALTRLAPQLCLEIDGGIGTSNIAECAAAGARWVVAGSAVFGKDRAVSHGSRFRELTRAMLAPTSPPPESHESPQPSDPKTRGQT